MKIKTSELKGRLLDWAVANAAGYQKYIFQNGFVRFAPSTRWDHGGPIIDREKIGVYPSQSVSGAWAARPNYVTHPKAPHVYGPNPLVAAMRCYVAANIGDTVNIPDEIIEE